MTQAAMAAALGMSQSNISFYEAGQEIRPEVAKKIIKLAADRGLTVTFDDIYGSTPSTSEAA